MSDRILDADGKHDPKCFSHHMGAWLIKPEVMHGLMMAHKAGKLPMSDGPERIAEGGEDGQAYTLYIKDQGVAFIEISGVMVKGESKFGGTTNTIRTRRGLRLAMADKDVETFVMIYDTPGGMAAGTPELAEDIRRANLKKPVFAHVDDDCGSAGYYCASQSGSIGSQATSLIGCIGTVIVLHDESKSFEDEGIKVIVVSTGEFKGAFAEGAPIPQEHIDYAQQIVDEHAEHFIKTVASGRKAAGMTLAQVRAAADGRMFQAATAKDMGLIDTIQRLDDTIKDARGRAQAIREAREQKSETPQLDRARRRTRAASASL